MVSLWLLKCLLRGCGLLDGFLMFAMAFLELPPSEMLIPRAPSASSERIWIL